MPQALRVRRADRRRRRGLHELGAAQGHPPGDAFRHARGRDRVRRGPQGRHVRGGAEGVRAIASTASAIRKELYPVRNVHQAFGYGSFAGAMFAGLSLVTGGWWFKDPLPAHGGWTRIQKLAEYYKDARPDPESTVNPVKIDRQLTFDRLTDVHYSGTRHRGGPAVAPRRARRRRLRDALPRGVRQPVHPLLPGERLRDGGRRRRRRRSCRSTRRTACTARRATSWTPTRSSTGCRPRAAADRSTKACRLGRC